MSRRSSLKALRIVFLTGNVNFLERYFKEKHMKKITVLSPAGIAATVNVE
jgi:hypothetical protein